LAIAVLAGVLTPAFAWANQPEAQAAIGRADGQIDIATRQAGAAGYGGDQSYDVARTRLEAARAALKDGRYDTAQMLADEASVLAELTVEKAKLAALQTSHDLVAKAANISPNLQ
jgi:hypothetical protein